MTLCAAAAAAVMKIRVDVLFFIDQLVSWISYLYDKETGFSY